MHLSFIVYAESNKEWLYRTLVAEVQLSGQEVEKASDLSPFEIDPSKRLKYKNEKWERSKDPTMHMDYEV